MQVVCFLATPLPKACSVQVKRIVRCSATVHPRHPVLVVGATSRVAQSTLMHLLPTLESSTFILTSRSIVRSQQLCESFSELYPKHVFQSLQFTLPVIPKLPSVSMLLHFAGPFQRLSKPTLLLDYCQLHGIPYVDICDDATHALACKSLDHDDVPTAVVCGGIYPGISNLLAAHATWMLGGSADEIQLRFYTAGSGGLGPTILTTTFLMLAEKEGGWWQKGIGLGGRAGNGSEMWQFDGDIGEKETYYLPLPEVGTLGIGLDVGRVDAKFGTGPQVWNWLLKGMAKFGGIGNRQWADMMAKVSWGVVKLVDKVAGGEVGIGVRAWKGDDWVKVGYWEKDTGEAVGRACAAFVREVREGGVKRGVWLPEELDKTVRDRILASMREGFKGNGGWTEERGRVGEE